MTYEEIMGITPGSIVPNGFSITPNATYIGPGEPILDAEGNAAPGGHYVNKWDKILVLDIGYTRQLTLIQYPVGNNEVRQGYITNSLSKIEYSDLENNFWQNGSTTETVYLSCSGDAVLGSLNPHERAIFLYKAGGRYSVVYSTDKGPYTKSGFVNYPGGISAQITQGRCLASGGSSINDIPAGGIVPGGRTYPANAVVKNDFLYIRDENGTIIPGRQTSIGDEITVLDISYSKQLALIQYPAGNDIRQGYVTNSTKIINYLNPYQWVNGSTPETVYLDVECTKEFGTIDPYESATLLYEKDGKYCVVYDAPGKNGGMDMLNKNGFVHFPGNKPQATPSAGDLLYQSFPANVEKIPYGTSPLGHPLNVYKIGNGSNVLFANFAIHGFEDDWNHDGTALVNIANELIRKISATGDLHGWTVYVNNCANPDGTFNGITNDGPGRCTVTTGIDMNRCFPSGFRPLYNTRNYVGASPLGAPEAVALKNIVERIHSEHINGSNQMVVIDFHGWMGMTQGNHEIGRYFNAQFNGDVYYDMAGGFFSTWAQKSLSSTRAVLVEYPKNTRSIDECDHRDYVGRTYNAIMNLLKENAGYDSSFRGWRKIDGNWYYFDTNGNKVKGWQTISGKVYKFDDNGVMQTGWIHEWGVYYYFGSDGAMLKGLNTIAGKEYYFNNQGIMQTGWQKINEKWYYFDTNGAMEKNQWLKQSNGQVFYLGADGVKYTGTHIIDGYVCKFDDGGVLYSKVKQGEEPKGNFNGKIRSGVESVYVRSQPIISNPIDANVLGELKGNDPIEILAKTKPYGDSYYWYKIVFVKNGERLQAYIREDFVTVTGEIPKSDIPAAGGEPSKIDIAYQTVGQVNDVAPSVHVRKGAGTGTGCDVVTSVNSGELLMILGEVQPGGETLPWYEIDINGQELYIRSDFVDIVSETKLDEQGSINSSEGWAHIRFLPGTGDECKVVKTLNNGTKVIILGKLQPKGDSLPWYRIRYIDTDESGKIGFIRSDLIGDGGRVVPSSNPNEGINDKYINIAKAFGFNINQSLSQGVLTQIKTSNNIYFQATAIVLKEEQLAGYKSLRVYNGRIINLPKNYDNLNIPYGKETLSRLAQMLGDGFITVKIMADNDITISINSRENGVRICTSLQINLQCISDISGWRNLLSGINSKYSNSEISFTKGVLIAVGVAGLAVLVIAFAESAVIVAGINAMRDAVIAELISGVGLEKEEDFIEDAQVVDTAESIAERAKALAPIMQEDLQYVRDDIKNTIYPNIELEDVPIKKLCEARDLTAPDNIFRRAFGGSGTHIPNVTIGNEIASELYEQLSNKEIIDELVKQSEYGLTDEWFREFYAENREFYEAEGINEDEVREELGKLRDMIQATKNKALEGEDPINEHGAPSLQKYWNVENCAEIWAVRNAIILGAKIENLVLKTVTFDKLKYAPPCKNCQVTFKAFIESGRLLK